VRGKLPRIFLFFIPRISLVNTLLFGVLVFQVQFRKVPHPTKVRVKYVMGVLSVCCLRSSSLFLSLLSGKVKLTATSSRPFSRQLLTDFKGENKWDECFKVANVRIEGNNYLGFSAATGDVAGRLTFLTMCSPANSSPVFHLTLFSH
jgi:hypothetical protein